MYCTNKIFETMKHPSCNRLSDLYWVDSKTTVLVQQTIILSFKNNVISSCYLPHTAFVGLDRYVHLILHRCTINVAGVVCLFLEKNRYVSLDF